MFRDGLRMKTVDRHQVRANALKFAAATYRREPEIVRLSKVRPQPYRIKVFEKQRPIKAYLRICKSRDYMSGQATEDLLEDAKFHVEEGEKLSIATLFERRLDSISQLKLRDQNMHRAICMLAYLKGSAKVIASLRYLGIIMRIEFNDVLHPAGIRDSLKRLEAKNLIEFDYSGKRSPGHTKSNIISVAFDLEFVDDNAPEYIVELLTMSQETVDALSDYTSKKVAAVVS